jgi:hypothetical protein
MSTLGTFTRNCLFSSQPWQVRVSEAHPDRLAGEFGTRSAEAFAHVLERAVSIVAGVLRDAGYRDARTGSDRERCEIQLRLNPPASLRPRLSA